MEALGTGWQARWMRGQGASGRLRQEGQTGRGGGCKGKRACVHGVYVFVCVCVRGACAHVHRSGGRSSGLEFVYAFGLTCECAHVHMSMCVCGGVSHHTDQRRVQAHTHIRSQ